MPNHLLSLFTHFRLLVFYCSMWGLRYTKFREKTSVPHLLFWWLLLCLTCRLGLFWPFRILSCPYNVFLYYLFNFFLVILRLKLKVFMIFMFDSCLLSLLTVFVCIPLEFSGNSIFSPTIGLCIYFFFFLEILLQGLIW